MDCIGIVIKRTEDDHGSGMNGMAEEYMERHGHHFSDSLAEHAVSVIENRDGSRHKWSVSQVHEAMKDMGILPTSGHKVTDGDLAYAANMAYADFYPNLLASETACLNFAKALAEDPDGYEGMIFDRWLTDVCNKRISINWKSHI